MEVLEILVVDCSSTWDTDIVPSSSSLHRTALEFEVDPRRH